MVETAAIMTTSTTTNTTETTTKTKGGYDVPWVEKYRPRNLDDVVGNEDTLVRLRAIAEDGNMPNLILCGPPGTGKVRSEIHLYIKFYDAMSSCPWNSWVVNIDFVSCDFNFVIFYAWFI
jgi:hypothetical protein